MQTVPLHTKQLPGHLMPLRYVSVSCADRRRRPLSSALQPTGTSRVQVGLNPHCRFQGHRSLWTQRFPWHAHDLCNPRTLLVGDSRLLCCRLYVRLHRYQRNFPLGRRTSAAGRGLACDPRSAVLSSRTGYRCPSSRYWRCCTRLSLAHLGDRRTLPDLPFRSTDERILHAVIAIGAVKDRSERGRIAHGAW
jgi:hypothetical protein